MGIFLMKECSKLYRLHKEREPHKLGKRLGGPTMSAAEVKTSTSQQSNRQNLGGGLFAELVPQKQGDMMMKNSGK